MAELSNSYKFSWVHWNTNAGRRNIFLHLMEYYPSIGKIKKNYSTVHITPLKACFVPSFQSISEINILEAENTKFSADLLNLIMGSSGIVIRNRVRSAKKDTVYTLAQFLISIRLFSFS